MKLSGVNFSGFLNTVKDIVDSPAVKATLAIAAGIGIAIALNSCNTEKQTQPDASSLQSLTEKLKRQVDDIKKELVCCT